VPNSMTRFTGGFSQDSLAIPQKLSAELGRHNSADTSTSEGTFIRYHGTWGRKCRCEVNSRAGLERSQGHPLVSVWCLSMVSVWCLFLRSTREMAGEQRDLIECRWYPVFMRPWKSSVDSIRGSLLFQYRILSSAPTNKMLIIR